jgi:hypothetical protein
MRSGDELLQITQGTNCEGLTPGQAYTLDNFIMQAVAVGLEMGVDYERFMELIEACWDTRCCELERYEEGLPCSSISKM